MAHLDSNLQKILGNCPLPSHSSGCIRVKVGVGDDTIAEADADRGLASTRKTSCGGPSTATGGGAPDEAAGVDALAGGAEGGPEEVVVTRTWTDEPVVR